MRHAQKLLKQLAILLFALLLVGACDKKESAGKESAAKPAETAGAEKDKPSGVEKDPSGDPAAPAPLVLPDPKVVVENAGGDNKVALRYAFQVGQETVAIMDMKMAMSITVGSQQQPEMGMPTIRMHMKFRNREVKTNGSVVYDFVLDDVDVLPEEDAMPQVVSSLKSALADMRGMNGFAEVDTRGITRAGDIRMPSNTNPQMSQMVDSMRQQMNQISIPLPEEPVGTGAIWTATTQLNSGGIRVNNVYRYELTSLEDSRMAMKVSLVQTAGEQMIQNPQLPPGTEVKLLELTGKGNGTMTMNLSRMVPTSELKSESSFKMEIKSGGQTQVMEQGIKINLKMTPKEN